MEYNKKVMSYFLKPKNVGKIANADGIGQVGNINCGDIMKIYIKIGKKKIKNKDKSKKEQEFIKEIKFETLGCPAAISTSSVVTELAKGKLLEEAIKITNKDVLKKLGELPPIKYHCSLLAEEALGEAIYDYLKKNKKLVPKKLENKHKRTIMTEKAFHNRFKR